MNRYPDTCSEVGSIVGRGMHPWHIPTAATRQFGMNGYFGFSRASAGSAVGEAGLDKLADAPVRATDSFLLNSTVVYGAW